MFSNSPDADLLHLLERQNNNIVYLHVSNIPLFFTLHSTVYTIWRVVSLQIHAMRKIRRGQMISVGDLESDFPGSIHSRPRWTDLGQEEKALA